MLKQSTPFVFLLDGRKIATFPTFKAGYLILNWMRSNKGKIPNVLLGSAVVLNNQSIIDILNWVFYYQPPISPNIITGDLEKGEEFLSKFKI
jgi:hypothetical protein